jgi:hypothetical protein
MQRRHEVRLATNDREWVERVRLDMGWEESGVRYHVDRIDEVQSIAGYQDEEWFVFGTPIPHPASPSSPGS